MTKFDSWILTRIFKKQVTQGGHAKNIQELYTMIRDAAAKEFYEDNHPAIDEYLQEWFDKTKFSTTKVTRKACQCTPGYCLQKAEFDAQC